MRQRQTRNYSGLRAREIDMDDAQIKEMVRARYGGIAASSPSPSAASCCGPAGDDAFAEKARRVGYSDTELGAVPEGANLGLGCGNPQAIAAMRPGEVVIDLGSGAGFDCFLAAQQVGATGRVIGVDMTHEMLVKARENAGKIGAANVEFRLGELEHLPVADNTADVVISNCVINLSGNKDRVLGEAFRVLKPGGRFAVSDVVTRGEVPEAIRRDVLLWVGCIAGALGDTEYREKLERAGFQAIGIEPTRVYAVEDAREFLAGKGIDVDALAPQVEGKFMSAFVRARKPGG
jgi:SAM-dependent methyltransferase